MDSRETYGSVNGGVSENANSDEIKATIDKTRDKMDQTLEELGERLHPRHLLDDVMDYLRNSSQENTQKVKRAAWKAASKCSRSVWHQIQEHPLPALMVGAGFVWMAMEKREKEGKGRSRYSEYRPEASAVFPYEEEDPFEAELGPVNYESEESPGILKSAKEKAKQKGRQMKETLASGAEAARSTAAAAGEKISNTARNVSEAASYQAHRLRESTQEIGSRVRTRAHEVYEHSEEMFRDAKDNHPLALGLGFMALGLLAGLIIPRTRTEDDYMGETATTLRERARERGEELFEQGKKAAVAAVTTASDEAENQGLTASNLGEKLGKVAKEVKHAAVEGARREGLDTQSLKEKAQKVGQEAKRAAQGEMSKPGQSSSSLPSTSTGPGSPINPSSGTCS